MSFSIVATRLRFSPPRAAAPRPSTRRISLAVLACILAGAGWIAFRTTASEGTATSREASGAPSCAQRLLADWADGRIDHPYPINCYRQAMKSLPADLEVYSSAPEDIESALPDRILQRSAKTTRRQSP